MPWMSRLCGKLLIHYYEHRDSLQWSEFERADFEGMASEHIGIRVEVVGVV